MPWGHKVVGVLFLYISVMAKVERILVFWASSVIIVLFCNMLCLIHNILICIEMYWDIEIYRLISVGGGGVVGGWWWYFLREHQVAPKARNLGFWKTSPNFPNPITCADFTVIVAALKPDFTGALKKRLILCETLKSEHIMQLCLIVCTDFRLMWGIGFTLTKTWWSFGAIRLPWLMKPAIKCAEWWHPKCWQIGRLFRIY